LKQCTAQRRILREEYRQSTALLLSGISMLRHLGLMENAAIIEKRIAVHAGTGRAHG